MFASDGDGFFIFGDFFADEDVVFFFASDEAFFGDEELFFLLSALA